MQRRPVREQPNRSNSGALEHGAGRANDPTVVHEVTGEIRWLDTELERIVVHVAEAGSHAGASLGKELTYDLSGARIDTEDVNGDGVRSLADLLPGVVVRVRTRMPRSQGASVPEMLSATSVAMVV